MKGKVYLVGAGPGDPDLLTVKALRLLQTADAVLHDDLVSTQILDLVPSKVYLLNVGKRSGTKNITQQEINFLLTSLASSGLAVVRLKGGDPLIFGRVGEEIEALRQANIEHEIVPGVTAALGAAADVAIPLTHRQISHAVVFLTGQRAVADTDEADWQKFVASRATLVIYMPGHELGEIALRLKRAGLDDETPCAIISRATTPAQQVHVTTVGGLAWASAGCAPALLIVGEVVRFAESSLVSEAAAWTKAANVIPALREQVGSRNGVMK